MAYYEYLWSDEAGGNVEHVAEHGLTPDDVEWVFENFIGQTVSRKTGMLLRFGHTEDGRHIVVVFEWADDTKILVLPLSAYETPERIG